MVDVQTVKRKYSNWIHTLLGRRLPTREAASLGDTTCVVPSGTSLSVSPYSNLTCLSKEKKMAEHLSQENGETPQPSPNKSPGVYTFTLYMYW